MTPPPPSSEGSPSSTADDKEVGRFTAIASEWWDPDGKFRPLHRLNPVRLDFILNEAEKHFSINRNASAPLAGLSVIDVGCGGGLLTEPMSRLGATVVGVDASEEAVKVADTHARLQGLNIDYRHALPEEVAKEGRTFDLVINMEVIEHVADVDTFLAACTTLLAPGGAMAISTLNRTIKSLALAKIGAEYVLRWLPAGTHDWRKFVRPSEFATALRRQGMAVTALRGMTYDVALGRWALSDNLDMNYLGWAIRS